MQSSLTPPASPLVALSDALADSVAAASAHVASVDAGGQYGASAVIWGDGVLVTTEHSLKNDGVLRTTLPDGTTVDATVAGRDPSTDLAVLKGDFRTKGPGLAAAGRIRAGEWMIAVGRASNTGINASMGIVSATGGSWRTWRGGRLDQFTRMDFNLFPGMTGGVIVNTRGELAGLASTALSRFAAVAIPASTVGRVVSQILASGTVARGFFGIGFQAVPFSGSTALIVLSVDPGGPAATVGVLLGDLLTAIDGNTVHDTDDIQPFLEPDRVGKTVQMTLVRGGVRMELPLVVGARQKGKKG